MLLFIQKRLSAEWMAELFQYISCYSLSEYGNLKKLQKSCFNTSHVTLYRVKTQLRADHPRSFNTSHVTLYPLWLNFRRLSQKSFNTSHVTLYLEVHDKQKHCRSFNTSHVTLYRCPNRTHSGHYGRFNTSHVTLYPMERRIAETVNKFQYISCYSLSQSLQFLRLDPVVSIHLMLLFITLRRAKWSKNCSFNTSHVTLYQCRILENSESKPFQYISCYSLSTHRILISPRSMRVSIHLMLLFIGLFNKMAHRK